MVIFASALTPATRACTPTGSSTAWWYAGVDVITRQQAPIHVMWCTPRPAS